MIAKRAESCRQLFKNRNHSITFRFRSDLHTTPANLTNFKNAFQKGGVRMEGRCGEQYRHPRQTAKLVF
jgi:hypothetical protein